MTGPILQPPTPQVPQGNAPADPTVNLTPQDKVAFGQITQDKLLQGEKAILDNLNQFVKDFSTILDKLQADQPNLPPGDPKAFSNLSNATGGKAVKLIAAGMDAGVKNPWFNGSASVAFMIAFQNFMRSTMQNELLQGTEIGPRTIMAQLQLAKDVGEQIMEAANQQASMEVAAAISAGISGAMSIGAAAITTVKWGSMASEGELAGANAKTGFEKLSTFSSTVQGFTSGTSSLATMGEKAYDSQAVVAKATAEAKSEILRTLLSLAQKRTQGSDESAQSSKELYNQFAQTLTQLLEQAVKARSLNPRG